MEHLEGDSADCLLALLREPPRSHMERHSSRGAHRPEVDAVLVDRVWSPGVIDTAELSRLLLPRASVSSTRAVARSRSGSPSAQSSQSMRPTTRPPSHRTLPGHRSPCRSTGAASRGRGSSITESGSISGRSRARISRASPAGSTASGSPRSAMRSTGVAWTWRASRARAGIATAGSGRSVLPSRYSRTSQSSAPGSTRTGRATGRPASARIASSRPIRRSSSRRSPTSVNLLAVRTRTRRRSPAMSRDSSAASAETPPVRGVTETRRPPRRSASDAYPSVPCMQRR